MFEVTQEQSTLNWGNAKKPSVAEMVWIETFGNYPNFNVGRGGIPKRVQLQIADLKQATRIIIYHHYLHRGRTMAQLPYWITVDGVLAGVMLYSLPRLSVPMFGIQPMNLLELARLWLSPSLQGHEIVDSTGRTHALSIASCSVAKSLRAVQRDWKEKYPSLPDIQAVISWADNVHHEGTIYKASNFKEMGQSGGTMHGNRRRLNGGNDQLNLDYQHTKTVFLFPFTKTPGKAREQNLNRAQQGNLFGDE